MCYKLYYLIDEIYIVTKCFYLKVLFIYLNNQFRVKPKFPLNLANNLCYENKLSTNKGNAKLISITRQS